MKITYKENPLCTTVELDDHEKEVFWYKLKIEELQDLLFGVHFNLEEGQFYDVNGAREEADPSYYLKEKNETKSKLDTRVDELIKYYLDALMGSHGGDCTCVPCSCLKCRAESILGVDTLKPFPGKHVLHRIDSAFRYKDGEEWKQRTLAEALAILKDYKVSRVKPASWTSHSQADYESYIPQWEEQAKKAYEYLLNYAKEHDML